MGKRLGTGISDLDKRLNGGLPPGSIITCTVDSRLQSELFLHRLIAEHDSAYISTIGNEESIKSEFSKSDIEIDISDVAIGYASPDATLQNVKSNMEQMNQKELIVVNSVNDLEDIDPSNRGSYQDLLNWMQNLNRWTNCVVLFNRYDTDGSGEFEYVTNSISDMLIEIEEHLDGDKIVNYMHIPKHRGGRTLNERLKVNLRGKVSIDTSRDIA